jgi:hypothetical protein
VKFINKTEVDEPRFEDIMTTEIYFSEDFSENEAAKFLKERDITYLPSRINNSYLYKLENNLLKPVKLEKDQRIDTEKSIFDKNVLGLFKKSEVLFVFSENKLVGVVHFCDYNREPVFIYGYSKILNFEKNLRNILIKHGLKNNDMKECFKAKADNIVFKKKYQDFDKLPIKSSEPFQCCYLLDLISLLAHKKILKISHKVNDLRNYIMHGRNIVEHKNYEEANLIYDFHSFENIFNLITLFNEECEKVMRECQKS